MHSQPPKNPRRVDIRDADDLLYWSSHFHVGTRDLMQAVLEIGTGVADLEKHLDQFRHEPHGERRMRAWPRSR